MLRQQIVLVMKMIGAGSDPKKQIKYIHLGLDIYWDGIKIDEKIGI